MEQAALITPPQAKTFSIACPFFHIAFLPSPTECEFYFGCKDGKSTLFECPPGTGFDTSKKQCILRYLVEKCQHKY